MSKNKFILDRKGVSDLMKSERMKEILNKEATNIRNRCGVGYEQTSNVGTKRANTRVIAATPKARRENKKNNTLLKAMR